MYCMYMHICICMCVKTPLHLNIGSCKQAQVKHATVHCCDVRNFTVAK